jgi:hypothetical protein
MHKQKLKKFIILFLVLFFIFFSLVFINYFDFIRERCSFNIVNDENRTQVVNSLFNFSFQINNQCSIRSNILNHLEGGVWSGELLCKNNREPISLLISKNSFDILSNLPEFGSSSRIYGGNIKEDTFDLRVIDRNHDKILIIWGNKFNKDNWSDILKTIREIN